MFNYILFLLACTSPDVKTIELPDQESIEKARDMANQMFGALPDKMPGSENDTKEKVALGKKLYFETRLSVNNSQSCNTCHRVDNGIMGVDGEVTSKGALGKRVHRNSPTVINAGFQLFQFWDGRAPNLKEQAKGPILAKGEMEMPSEEAVLDVLNSDADYIKMFDEVYGKSSVTYDNLADAIAAFERTLISKDKFDEFQKGNVDLTKEELDGFNLFINTGCVSCHNGNLFGGKGFQKAGIISLYDEHDLGRFNITGQESDKFVFKIPTLRNIEMTGPYFHDGKVETLDRAISTMAKIQLGKNLSDSEIKKIRVFLHTLTGEVK